MEHQENILVSAKEAFESTKQPQLENLAAEINRQRSEGIPAWYRKTRKSCIWKH